MFRTLLRTIGLASLAVALVAAVLDMTRSIADSAIVMKQFGHDWTDLSPTTLAATQSLAQTYLPAFLWDPVILQIFAAPTWAVFGGFAIIMLFLGRRKTDRWQEKYRT